MTPTFDSIQAYARKMMGLTSSRADFETISIPVSKLRWFCEGVIAVKPSMVAVQKKEKDPLEGLSEQAKRVLVCLGESQETSEGIANKIDMNHKSVVGVLSQLKKRKIVERYEDFWYLK